MTIFSSALVVVEHPRYFFRTSKTAHILRRRFIVVGLALNRGGWHHTQYRHANLTSLKGRCPLGRQDRKANIPIRVDMFVYGRLTNKHNFRGFERISVIKFELQGKILSCIQSSNSTLELNMPDRYSLIHYVKFKDALKVLNNVLSFFVQSFSLVHF